MTSSYQELCKMMQNKANDFKKHLMRLNTLNNDIIERTEKIMVAMHEMMGDTSKKMCPICYSHELSHAYTCGHCFCEACAQRGLERNKCAVCRARVTSCMKLYL